MTKFRVLFIPLALYIWIGTTLMFLTYSFTMYKTLQKERLDIVVNYAADAAVDELVRSSADLNLDYAEYERTRVEPSVALDMFCMTFLKNYNMSLSDANMAQIKTRYLSAFCVAAYDGYYISQPTKFKPTGVYDSIFSMKNPYVVEKDGKSYALNLMKKTASVFDGKRIYTETNLPFTQQAQSQVINDRVTTAFMNTIYRQQEGGVDGYFYLPWSYSNVVRTNPIDRVTVLAFVSNFDVGINTTIDAYAIGGAKAEREQFVGCYTLDGEKLYTYSDRVPEGVNVELVLKNAQEAAKRGYRFDLQHVDKH